MQRSNVEASKNQTQAGGGSMTGLLRGALALAVVFGISKVLNPEIGMDAKRARPTASSTRRGGIKSLWSLGLRVFRRVQEDRLLLVAAGVTFYALLALFPATAAIVSLYGLVADGDAIEQHLAMLRGLLPEGALQVIGDQAKRIASQGGGTLGFAFAGTLLLSLWGANGGTKAIIDALNIINRIEEKRSFIAYNVRSLLITLGAILVVVAAMFAIVALPIIMRMLGMENQVGAWIVDLFRWPLLLGLLIVGLAVLYHFGPSFDEHDWTWMTWGSATASILWVVVSAALSFYIARFGNLNATYGSLGAVIGFLFWMWISTIVVLVGAEIDVERDSHNRSN